MDIPETTLIHITTPAAWAAGSDTPHYAPARLVTEGFIHASRTGQVRGVLGRHYAGHRALLLLLIDPQNLTYEVREEEAGHGEIYPHVYGPIDRAAVFDVIPIEADATGSFQLPDGID